MLDKLRQKRSLRKLPEELRGNRVTVLVIALSCLRAETVPLPTHLRVIVLEPSRALGAEWSQ